MKGWKYIFFSLMQIVERVLTIYKFLADDETGEHKEKQRNKVKL